MSNIKKVNVLIEGGAATPGPPLAPALGPMGVNVRNVVAEINEKTKDFTGMKVPVTIEVAPDKTYNIVVGFPPTSALILKEAGISKGSETPNSEAPIATITRAQCEKIAKIKRDKLLAITIEAAIREIVGTARSMGIEVKD
ncbi:MAG: 50S ribosomal protein L11 [Promethearchaeota archaeon]